jgi:hypothetical protein
VIKGSFTEPGCGIEMQFDKWYIISDAGGCYTDKPFDTPGEAVNHAFGEHRVALDDIHIWNSKDPRNGLEEAKAANVVKGIDLFIFWAADDYEMLKECNELD